MGRFDAFQDPYLADPYPFFAQARPEQTLRFQPNTTFRGPLSLLVEWDT